MTTRPVPHGDQTIANGSPTDLEGLVRHAIRLLEQVQDDAAGTSTAPGETVLPLEVGVAGLAAALQALAAADGHLRHQVAAHTRASRSMGWEQRYRTVFEMVPDACFLTDVAGVIREANHATSGLLGYARRYCLGKPVAALFVQENAERVQDTLAQAATLAEGKVLTWEGRCRPKRRGESPSVVVRVSAIRDRDGALAGFSWLVRDVSAERHLAGQHRALEAEQDARLRTRTAELEATVKVQAALIEQQRADGSA